MEKQFSEYLKNLIELADLLTRKGKAESEESQILISIEIIHQLKKTVSSQLEWILKIENELTEYSDLLNETDLMEWGKYKLENSIEEEKQEIESELSYIKEEILELINTENKINEIINSWKYFKDKYEKEIPPMVESLKHFWEKYTLMIPNDFSKVIAWSLKEENSKSFTIEELPEIIKSINIQEIDLIKWSKEYSDTIKKLLSTCLIRNNKKQPKEILTLKERFEKKFGKLEGEETLNELKSHLFKKSLLSEDLTTWVGNGMNGKEQLASLIKFIGMKFFQNAFSEKEVGHISENDFNLEISSGTIKKAKSENGEYYLSGFPYTL